MSNDRLHFASLNELSKLLRAKKISSVELTKIFLDRLETLGPNYNALAELTRDRALEQARRADKLFRRGVVTTPLQGIPYGAKDLLATKNIPTRWGAPPFRDQIFNYDATVIRKLADAGADRVPAESLLKVNGRRHC